MAELVLLTIYTDGASRGNPGAAAFAYVIGREGEPPIEEAGCLGTMTNNQAEYTALVRALEHAFELGTEHRLLIHSDSELMVKQMRGEYRVKNEDLLDLYEQARALVHRFDGPVTFRHVRREQNSRADQLCNEALDGLRCPTPRGQPAAANSAAPVPVPAAAVSPLREEAIAVLRKAEEAWAAGGIAPTPEQVWSELESLLRRHGARLPGPDPARSPRNQRYLK
jgi:ribonuclease HI